MTAMRDPDRTLRAWLDLVPDEVPDRVLEAVLDQIDVTPQVGRPWVAGRWRFFPMPRLLIAGAAVVLAVVVGAIALRPGAGPSVAGSPMPSATPATALPSSSAPGSVVAGPVPAGLQHRWMGGPNSLAAATIGSSMLITANSLAVAASNRNDQPLLTADVSAPSTGQLRLTTAGSRGVCGFDSVGTYDWSLSPSGRVLNVNLADDACTERSGALLGTWWSMDCKDATDNCLGPLDGGTYASQFLNFQKPASGWQPKFGALSYSVPEGWANDADWPARLGLSPMAAYAQWTPADGTPSGIDVLADVAADATDPPCASTAAPGVDRTPKAIVDAIRATPGLVVSDSADITLDGHAGAWLDLTVDEATVRPCDGGDRVVEYLVSAGEGQALLLGERARVIVLAASPTPLAIVIVAPADQFDALIPPAMRIVKSMQFK